MAEFVNEDEYGQNRHDVKRIDQTIRHEGSLRNGPAAASREPVFDAVEWYYGYSGEDVPRPHTGPLW
jgi:hypothetical protein